MEGHNDDLFQAVDALGHSTPGGPTFPTLGTRLFSSLDAAEQTVAALGKKPTPEEVDRSNLRRLLRAMEPLMGTYRDCYPAKDFDRAAKEFKSVAGALGQYKDISVVEAEVASLNGGVVPRDVAKWLEKSRAKRAEKFEDTYKHFRKKGLSRALKTLRKPRSHGVPDPQRLLREDKERLLNTVRNHLEVTVRHGMIHRDPVNFHESRKALRATVNALNSADGVLLQDKEAVTRATTLVDAYGQAQDAHIAESWLRRKGFKGQADRMAERYRNLQEQALGKA